MTFLSSALKAITIIKVNNDVKFTQCQIGMFALFSFSSKPSDTLISDGINDDLGPFLSTSYTCDP